MELSHNSQWAIMAHTAHLETEANQIYIRFVQFGQVLPGANNFAFTFFRCVFSGTFLSKNNAFLIASPRKEQHLSLVAPCVHVFLVVGLTLIFIFVSVHHHGRGYYAAGHRDHVHAPEDGVLPDPEPGRGTLAGAAPPLISWKVSGDRKTQLI